MFFSVQHASATQQRTEDNFPSNTPRRTNQRRRITLHPTPSCLDHNRSARLDLGPCHLLCLVFLSTKAQTSCPAPGDGLYLRSGLEYVSVDYIFQAQGILSGSLSGILKVLCVRRFIRKSMLLRQREICFAEGCFNNIFVRTPDAVSYTHLTLPTIYSV